MNFYNKISGGHHIHNYHPPPTQRELDMDTKTTCTFRIAPKLKEHIEKRAKQAGIKPSAFIESILYKYLKVEPKLKEVYGLLDDVIVKNF